MLSYSVFPANSWGISFWEANLYATLRFASLPESKVKWKYLIFHFPERESNSQPSHLQSHACTLASRRRKDKTTLSSTIQHANPLIQVKSGEKKNEWRWIDASQTNSYRSRLKFDNIKKIYTEYKLYFFNHPLLKVLIVQF